MASAAPENGPSPRQRLIRIVGQFEDWLLSEKENGASTVNASPALVRSLGAAFPLIGRSTPGKASARKSGAPPAAPDIVFISSDLPDSEADQLLTRMIQAMGYDRSEVVVEPVSPDLQGRIRTLKPKIIVPLGEQALTALVNAGHPFARGRWLKWLNFDVLPTHGPAQLVTQPALKKDAWLDLQAVLKKLGRKAPEIRKKA